jgi:hypothetical protein
MPVEHSFSGFVDGQIVNAMRTFPNLLFGGISFLQHIVFIRSKSLWRWYISTNILLLFIIHRPVIIQKHRPVYFSKHNVSETGFCLRLQVNPTQMSPIDRASPYVRPNWVGFTWRRKQNPVAETLCLEK